MPLHRMMLLGLVALLAGCGPLTFTVGTTPADMPITETVVVSDGRWFSDRVAIVEVSGLLVNAEKPGLLAPGENPVSRLHEQLALAERDSRVKAVILRLNTPGGTVTASDAMYREVRRFREVSGKPVVALMMDVTTSGGYYVACAADRIVAYPTSVTGSIGVLVQTISVKPALERWGVHTEAITSGPNKDAGSPLSTLTPDQRAVLRGLVDDFYQRFVEVVRTRRPAIPAEAFDTVVDGRVMSGEQAAALGLADRVGDVYDAFAEAKAMAQLARADLVVYHRPLEYVASPYATWAGAGVHGGAGAAGGQINLLQLNLGRLPGLDAPVGIYYLWAPDAP